MRDAKKTEENERKISAAGRKIISDNVDKFVMRAIVNKWSILDCVVLVDMCQSPPSVSIVLPSAFISTYAAGNVTETESEYYQKLLERNRKNDSIAAAVLSMHNDTKSIMIKTVPAQ